MFSTTLLLHDFPSSHKMENAMQIVNFYKNFELHEDFSIVSSQLQKCKNLHSEIKILVTGLQKFQTSFKINIT